MLLQPEAKHSDDRRTLEQLLTAPVSQLNRYTVKRGAVLGNHYHVETVEYFYVTKGTISMMTKKLGAHIWNSRILNKDSLFKVEPRTVHVVEAMTNSVFLTFLSRPYKAHDTDIWQEKEESNK